MQLNQKKMGKSSNENVVKAILWSYLRLNRDTVDKLFAIHPEYKSLCTAEFEQAIKKFYHVYLLTNDDMINILVTYPEIIQNPTLVYEKEDFLRKRFNIGEIEFGRVLHNNLNIVYESDELTEEIAHNLKTKCGLSDHYIRNILLNSNLFTNLIKDSTYDVINKKFQLFDAFNLPSIGVYNNPSILGNGLDNTLQKLIIAHNMGYPTSSYVKGKFYFQKEKAYARMHAVKNGWISLEDAYISEWDMSQKYSLTSKILMSEYPWTNMSNNELWEEFEQISPELAEKVSNILNQNQDEME